MNVEIKSKDYDYTIKKNDVWIVYTTTNKCWVCTIGGVIKQGNLYILTLAEKGKSVK